MVLECRGKSLVFFFFTCSLLWWFYAFSELKCTPWHLHETFGHTRDVSFQHPIKIYFGIAALYVFAFLLFHLLHEFVTRAYMLCRLILFYVSLCFWTWNNVLCCHKGAKFGSCQELQKFRVHRNRFLINCLLYHLKMFLELVSINCDYYCLEGMAN